MAPSQEDIDLVIAEFERDAGVAAGFYRSLLEEDDWSFVLKMNALFEAALARALPDVLGRPELVSVFSFVELADVRKGKVAFAGALGLLDKPKRRFIASLAELRNALAHDVRNAGSTFEKYFSSLEESKIESYFRAFDLRADGAPWFQNDLDVPRKDFFVRHPKEVIWLFALLSLCDIHLHKEVQRSERALEKSAVEKVFRR